MRDLILSTPPKLTPVSVPGWGSVVFVKRLSLGERQTLRAILDPDNTDRANADARFLILVAMDSDGKPIFSEADIPKINELDAADCQIVIDAALVLNGLSVSAVDDAKKN